jgi:hypothetical protein
VVEGNGLENRRAGNGTEGSNPSLSAKKKEVGSAYFFFLGGSVGSEPDQGSDAKEPSAGVYSEHGDYAFACEAIPPGERGSTPLRIPLVRPSTSAAIAPTARSYP